METTSQQRRVSDIRIQACPGATNQMGLYIIFLGTGLVHTAPGHGQEDYLVGQKYGLDLLSPVDDAGNFTEEAGERFKGLNVQVICVI